MSGDDRGHPLDVLSGYLDDELSVEQRSRVDRHLAECDVCRGHLASLERLARAIGAEEAPVAPLDLAGRIGRALDAATARPPARRRPFVPVTIAATLAAIGLLVVVSWRQGEQPVPKVSERPPDPAPVVAPETTRKDEVVPLPVEPDARVETKEALAPADALRDAPAAAAPPSGAPPAPRVLGPVEGDARDAPAARQRAEAFARSSVPAPAPAPCGEGFADTGLRVPWPSADASAADRELGQMARDVRGTVIGERRPPGVARVLVVPRDRFEEVFFALRARGLSGLDTLPTLGPTEACVGVTILLEGSGAPPR